MPATPSQRPKDMRVWKSRVQTSCAAHFCRPSSPQYTAIKAESPRLLSPEPCSRCHTQPKAPDPWEAPYSLQSLRGRV
ncbi:hypothetical protein OH77DRAFT_1429228 [Trametes cingulata]|nr:hypothetical protein OH77DRAFT_1429228 [Trametes cingulata]